MRGRDGWARTCVRPAPQPPRDGATVPPPARGRPTKVEQERRKALDAECEVALSSASALPLVALPRVQELAALVAVLATPEATDALWEAWRLKRQEIITHGGDLLSGAQKALWDAALPQLVRRARGIKDSDARAEFCRGLRALIAAEEPKGPVIAMEFDRDSDAMTIVTKGHQ